MKIFLLALLVGAVWGQTNVNEVNNAVVPDYNRQNFEELLSWEAPKELQKGFPYYLSGYDDEDSPIWIVEYGKWDSRKVVDAGIEKEKELRKYMQQFLARVVKSIGNKSTPGNVVQDFNTIIDLQGYGSGQASSPKTIGLTLWFARQIHLAWLGKLRHGFLVNTNYIFSTVWDLMKPLLGPNIYKIEVFGNNKDKWLPNIIRTFPKSEIPKWYGGSSEHKPVVVYG